MKLLPLLASLLLATAAAGEDFSWSTGTKRVLDIRLRFVDLAETATADSDLNNLRQASTRFVGYSYGAFSLTPTVTPKVYVLPHIASYYASMGESAFRAAIATDADALASVDYDLSTYDRRIYHFPNVSQVTGSTIHNFGWGECGARVWMNGAFKWRNLTHELGHSVCLPHADLWKTKDGDPVSATGTWRDKGDKYDVMGGDWSANGALDFNPYYKWEIGWLPESKVQRVTASGTYRVYRFDHPQANGAVLALTFPKDTEVTYWIGYRRAFLLNETLSNGAYVTWANEAWRMERLIDFVPGTDYQDAAVPIGKTLQDGAIAITPVANGGSSPNEWLDVEITI